MLVADILLSIASFFFTISLVPQIAKVIDSRSASQFSWTFLVVTAFSILLFVIGKAMVHCLVASMIDVVSFIGYIILIVLKFYYGNERLYYRGYPLIQ